ncbi:MULTISPECIES: hypothetical protein [Pseudomonadaceae]|jgi:hypothetical protein|uniref:hypothetical protein n=1 Tax=Pseudomonadaceae TaxID=135621 RepID=UPI000F7985E4|nr:hypothetical protein [Stutzerimonas stutzeri]
MCKRYASQRNAWEKPPSQAVFLCLHKSRTTSMVAVTCSPLCQWIIGVVISMVISMVISI